MIAEGRRDEQLRGHAEAVDEVSGAGPARAAPPPVMAQAPFAAALAPEPRRGSIRQSVRRPRRGRRGGRRIHSRTSPSPSPSRIPSVEVDDPFAEGATEIHDAGAERAELEELLANARGIVATLEAALERARENERVLMRRLQILNASGAGGR